MSCFQKNLAKLKELKDILEDNSRSVSSCAQTKFYEQVSLLPFLILL